MNTPETLRARYERTLPARRAFMEVVKSYPCLDCGVSYPAACMDFDHVRGDKDRHLSQMTMGNFDRLRAEIAKCELICANCHRLRTHG